jgi:8-oxo-dGTP pyrophosphatase MutT (NUDIX family)
MRTIERDTVAAVIVSNDGKILQALKGADGVYPNCWGLFGGGIDEGEDERTALNREVMEEAGVDISPYAARLIRESKGESEKTLKDTGERVFVKMNFKVYEVILHDKDASGVAVTLDHEHTEYRWSRPSEIKDLQLTPPSVELFKELGYL